ncbi:MAG TPA: NUDIX hydrolase [Aeromicrobium sp.]|nr:NUDIX hydrolase [Aeromicrobium sp.]
MNHPSLPGSLAPPDLADHPHAWPVAASTRRWDNPFLSVRTDRIVDPSGEEHDRAVVEHRGAVAILALDEDDRVLLVEQYRHPVGLRMLEIPAGVLDVDGESSREAAARELGEEADVAAATWEELFTMAATPGYSTEQWVLWRATGLSPLPQGDRTRREAEEADLVQWWMPLDDAVEAILAGRIGDALTVAGILSEQVRRRSSHDV